MKLIIFGATGMVGQAVLLCAQVDPHIKEIVAVVRKDDLVPHSKLKVIVHKDFQDLSPCASVLSRAEGTIFAIGVTSAGKTEEEYTKQTFDLTLSVAKQILTFQGDHKTRFVYVSGAGADSSEKGPVMWARVRGKTENTLMKLPFVGCYAVRPGIIIPQDGIQSKTGAYRIGYVFMKPILPLMRVLLPKQVTTSRILGALLVRLAVSGSEKMVLESKDFDSL